MFIGALYMVLTLKTLMHHHTFKQKANKRTLDFMIMLDLTLAVVMGIFNVWNWFLAF